MRLGAALDISTNGAGADAGQIADTAKRIADAGFESLWVFDCIGRGELVPDPLMMLAVAATATEGLELGTGIVQVPLRETVELAHRVFSAQLLCGGRLALGVSYGSTRADYEAIGLPFEERKARFDAAMPRLRALLETGRAGGRSLAPWPAGCARVRVLLGTWGREVETAARDYDGWVGSAHYRTDEQLGAALARYRKAGGQRAVATNLKVPADGQLDPLARRLERLEGFGFDDAVVVLSNPTSAILGKIRGLL